MDVRMVRAGPTRLAFVHAFGDSPEEEAIGALLGWAGPVGLLDGPRGFHLFGANDPPPGGPGEAYGYFFGVTVPDGVELAEGIGLRDLPAATYAVTRVRGVMAITDAWRALYAWVEGSDGYEVAGHGLEELLSPPGDPVDEWTFDLWLPTEER